MRENLHAYARVRMSGDEPPMSATFFTQLSAAIVRNLTRKKRNRRHTFRELFGPIYFLAVIILIKSFLPSPYYEAILSPPGSSNPLKPSLLHQRQIAYAPNSTEVENFMSRMGQIFHVHLNLTAFQSEKDIEDFYSDQPELVNVAIVFSQLDSNLRYKIRMSSSDDVSSITLPAADSLFAEKEKCRNRFESKSADKKLRSQIKGLQGMPSNFSSVVMKKFKELISGEVFLPYDCPVTSYYWSGFTTIQLMLDNTFLTMKNSSHVPPNLEILQLPKDVYTGSMETVLRSILPLYMTFSVSQFLTPMLMVVVLEKEKRIKESLRMVGLRDSVFWLSWFLVYGILIFIISILGSFLINFVIFNKTKSYLFVTFLLMLEFGLSIIMFAFVMTALFNKAKPAGIAGGLSLLLISCLYYLQVYLGDSAAWVYWLLGLLSPTAFAMSMDKILMWDIRGIPFSLDLLFDTTDLGIPIGGAIIMIAIDIVLYGLFAAWLDNVLPSEYGIKKPVWFCFLPSYWLPRQPQKTGFVEDEIEMQGDDIEAVTSHGQSQEAIVISRLEKTFTGMNKAPVHAVQGISLKIYTGEITAILGHNGAGKSTLFNMLTGMTAATAGQAHVFGYDIRDPDQMEEIRKMTGICPQHDVLFDELTPREHLRFFAKIRGLAKDTIESEVDSVLGDIDLTEKADAMASKLSGGQKRKLSVGIALIGDPPLIFLDEPTAGVDPYSRRHLWSVLKKRKEGKVILLTTHFMDEADILADRKAIMTRGKIRCYGSSLFLKNKFGLGYHLTLVMGEDKNQDAVVSLVQEHQPAAKLTRVYGKEMSFLLPREEVDAFPELFLKIEDDIKSERDSSLGISSYGVSMTTLEEVFLRLGEEEEELDSDAAPNGASSGCCLPWWGSQRKRVASSDQNIDRIEPGDRSRNGISQDAASLNSGTNLVAKTAQNVYNFESVSTQKSTWQTYKSLVYVRFIRKFREPASVLVQMVLPVVYVCLGVFLSDNGFDIKSQDKELFLNNSLYKKDFASNMYGFQNFSRDPTLSELFDSIANYTGDGLLKLPDDASYLKVLNDDIFCLLNYTDFFTEMDLKVEFNDTAIHSIPIAINTISNGFAQLYGQGEVSISSQPFRLTKPPSGFDGFSFGGGMLVGLTYIFIPIGFALELIEDREIRAKNQLRVNGLGFLLYFASFFTVLGGMLLVLLGILLGLVAIFDFAPLMIPAAFFTFSSMYLLYTVPALLFSACLSYLFDTVESGQFLFPIASYCGFIPYIVVSITKAFNVMDGDLAKGLHIAFSFLSPIYIPFGVLFYISQQFLVCSITNTCDQLTVSDYMVEEIWVLYVALLFHTLLWSVVLFIADIKKDGGNILDFLKRRRSRSLENEDTLEDEDEDVKAERTKVAGLMDAGMASSQSQEAPVVGIYQLRKVFQSGLGSKISRFFACGKEDKKAAAAKVAVRNLSLSVCTGEVFGLLGHNGAGKTTTMRIITAEEKPSAGRIMIGQREILSNQSEAYQELGYCPQFDAVWKTVTIREHLQAYAAIRGVPPAEINMLVKRYMEGLRIEEHADKLAKNCSGGTKRKLSYAMAMLGNPKIVLLDEPSTGMDPQSKRFVWNTIQASFRTGRGAILTTHSMEEADSLCSRVGIMVNGELRCVGSTQHLKNKYGGGYLLEIKWKSSEGQADWISLEEYLKEVFPAIAVSESFADRRSYSVEQTGFSSLATAFQHLESCKSRFNIEDYTFSQTTLEQVFIEFAKQQEAEDAAFRSANSNSNPV